MISTGSFAILQLCLRNGGAEVHVPQRWCFLCVGLAARQVVEKCLLRGTACVFRDGGVQQGPIHRETESSEEVLEDLLILCSEFVAQLDEVRARHRYGSMVLGWVAAKGRCEAGNVGQRWIARDTEVVLHSSLGRKTVVVPTHRVKHVLASHALITGNGVGMGVGKHVSHVQ